MRPQSCKAKGRRLQQELVAAIRAAFPHLEDDDIRNTPMGTQGEDILLSPAARKVWPFSTECKNVEALNIWKALAQAEGKKHPPIVVFRKNATKPHVALPLEVFLRILRRADHGTEGTLGSGPV